MFIRCSYGVIIRVRVHVRVRLMLTPGGVSTWQQQSPEVLLHVLTAAARGVITVLTADSRHRCSHSLRSLSAFQTDNHSLQVPFSASNYCASRLALYYVMLCVAQDPLTAQQSRQSTTQSLRRHPHPRPRPHPRPHQQQQRPHPHPHPLRLSRLGDMPCLPSRWTQGYSVGVRT